MHRGSVSRSFLLVSGYLKTVGRTFDEDRNLYLYKLKIPNIEISILYKNIIEKWFKESFVDSEFKKMLKALIEGDIDNFAKIFKRYVLSSFSYFDVNGKNPEKVYHAFVLGLLVSLSKTHEVVSNRESGIGRYDVSLIPKDTKKHGIIFEFKRYDKEDAESLDEVLIGALQQIEDKKYDTELRNRGIKNIIKLAIVFSGKDVYIRENR
ncbi:PD-(D/E)XK nuclease domain-containing protein [Clostridium sp.]|uniref:PD-(D/E)XK nuclease domain-containing protein n=1 Tax=Clostridium sp. TaxID=1506 RepID=UPI001B6FDDEB|nr:PD-(D/E)XK nuclease domain-containing protein [Clostridium sp.]MBP3916749.1 PD-(D/E)XK nuclease domain-containing protein [Clostridium sp.]